MAGKIAHSGHFRLKLTLPLLVSSQHIIHHAVIKTNINCNRWKAPFRINAKKRRKNTAILPDKVDAKMSKSS